MKEISKIDYEGQFGLGCVQWTGERTASLIECYKAVCGNNNYPTFEQCIEAECMFIVQELGEGKYHEVYEDWCMSGEEINSVEGAVQAGIDVCKKYEKPRTDTSVQRGEAAGIIYEIFIGEGKDEE